MRFLFFDRIVEIESAKRIIATKAIGLDGAYFTLHYPLRPSFPATLVIESIAQAAGWLNFVTHDQAIRMVVALVENVRFLGRVQPGVTLELEAQMEFVHPGGATMKGEARVGGERVVTIERLVFANQAVGPEGFSAAEQAHFDYVRASVEAPQGGGP